MGKGKKKGYFNNKTKTVKVSPDILLNNTCRLTVGRAKNCSKFPILLRYTDNHDEKHFSIVNKIKNASDEDLDEMIEEYFEYHDTKYGIDYNYNIRDLFFSESFALYVMHAAWENRNYRLIEKLAKRGVTLDIRYFLRGSAYPNSYLSLALHTGDATLLEIVVKNGGRIDRVALFETFYTSNEVFEYLVENVRDKHTFTCIFELLLIRAKPMFDDTAIQRRTQLLLDKGACPDETYNGKSMIDYALSCNKKVDRDGILEDSVGQILKAYINTGIGTSYISSIELSKIELFDEVIGIYSKQILHIKINSDNGIASHTLELKDYHQDGIEHFIMNKHNEINKIINMINLIIPQPIAEEIIPNIFLL